MTENIIITNAQNFYGIDVLIGYSFSSLAVQTFAHATYSTINGQTYPTVVLSAPAMMLESICPNVMAWIIGHEVGHIVNGDLDTVKPDATGIANYEEIINGGIPEIEFRADRFSWDNLDEEAKEGVKREIPYLLVVLGSVFSAADFERVDKQFRIKARALGFEISTITRKELDMFAEKYNALREEWIAKAQEALGQTA